MGVVVEASVWFDVAVVLFTGFKRTRGTLGIGDGWGCSFGLFGNGFGGFIGGIGGPALVGFLRASSALQVSFTTTGVFCVDVVDDIAGDTRLGGGGI